MLDVVQIVLACEEGRDAIAAGLVAEIDTRRVRRAGFKVRKFSRREVGVLGDSLTPEQWLTAIAALEAADLTITYRSDEGRAARMAAHRTPGPDISAARWLLERGVVATGTDTETYEVQPAPDRGSPANPQPVHTRLLIENGIYLMESLYLEELARELERMGLTVERRVFQQTLFGGRAVISGGVFVIKPSRRFHLAQGRPLRGEALAPL